MLSTAPEHGTGFVTRLVASVLLVAFLLQSAARAGEGCLARVFSGSCCCTAVADAPAPVHSCCAPAPQHAPEESMGGPSLERQRDCHCSMTRPPLAPAVSVLPDLTTERSLERILFAHTVAAVTCAVGSSALHVEQRALDRPPDPPGSGAGSFARTRLAQRGVAGLLSELCTLRR